MTTSFRVIIPSRFGSTRLPAKALCDINGKPMIQHVYERACQSEASSVIVATDDERIAKVCEQFNAEVCLTSPDHLTGTDRLSEVTQKLNYAEDEIIVNAQGDQPLISPENINLVARNLMINSEVNMSTLCERIYEHQDLTNASIVKVVMNNHNHALYFSRSLIPYFKNTENINLHNTHYYKHMGIYAYRVNVIQQFVNWVPSDCELSESLEQLRFLSNGEKIHIDIAAKPALFEINTPEDLDKVRDLFRKKLIA
jgi:3-deoxy-manno-octulosonate cytidylyltransferase (CMP-KDO synthetase)